MAADVGKSRVALMTGGKEGRREGGRERERGGRERGREGGKRKEKFVSR